MSTLKLRDKRSIALRMRILYTEIPKNGEKMQKVPNIVKVLKWKITGTRTNYWTTSTRGMNFVVITIICQFVQDDPGFSSFFVFLLINRFSFVNLRDSGWTEVKSIIEGKSLPIKNELPFKFISVFEKWGISVPDSVCQGLVNALAPENDIVALMVTNCN